jgi:hypothetical protein
VHIDITNLPDRADHGRRAMGKTTVIRSLDHCNRRFSGAVDHVNRVLALKLQPLAIVNRRAAGYVSGGIQLKRLSAIRRLAGGDVRRHETRIGQHGRSRSIVRVKSDCDIDVAAAVATERGRRLLRKRIRLTAIDRIAHVRIVGRAAGAQIEIPEIHARRHAANC